MKIATALFLASLSGLGLTTAWAVMSGVGRIPRLERRVDVLTLSATRWEAHARGWMATAKESDRLRRIETKQGRDAISAADIVCDDRVGRARRSAAAIQAFVNKEPKYDQSHCPVRDLADPVELRHILRP